MQMAADNLVAAGRGGTVRIEDGSYNFIGTWKTDPNATDHSYLFGIGAPSVANRFMQINFEGAALGAVGEIYANFNLGNNTGPLNTVGTQIKVLLPSTVLPNSHNSVFYSPVVPGQWGNENYLAVQMNRMRWTAWTTNLTGPGGCDYSMIDAVNLSGFSVTGGLAVDVNTTNTTSVGNQVQVSSFGLRLPNGGNQEMVNCDFIWTALWHHGCVVQDHANIGYLCSHSCNNGLSVSTESHSAMIAQYSPAQCESYIELLTNPSQLEILLLDPEPVTGLTGTFGFNFSNLFNNNFENFQGQISWNASAYGIPAAGSLGTLPGGDWEFRLRGNPFTMVAGSSAGTAKWNMPFMGTNYKKFFMSLNAYNSTGKPVSFTIPFLSTPVVTSDVNSLVTSLTASGFMIASTGGAAKNGIVVLEGI